MILLLTSCGRSDQAEFNQARFQSEGEDLNRHLAEVNALLGPEMPRGWHYTVRRDQIRNYDQRLATLASEDGTAVIGVQSWSDSPPSVLFRAMEGFRCTGECSVTVSIDGRQSIWGGYSSTGETITINYPQAEALAAVRSGRVII